MNDSSKISLESRFIDLKKSLESCFILYKFVSYIKDISSPIDKKISYINLIDQYFVTNKRISYINLIDQYFVI
jgi:hypothetical protein